MPLPILPLVIAGLAGAIVLKKRRDAATAPTMTPARQVVLDSALANEKDPQKLGALADAFAAQKLTTQAQALRMRASLRSVPLGLATERRDAFRKAMSSQDPVAVESLAAAFRKQGATGTADQLTKYAQGLRTGHLSTTPKRVRPSVATAAAYNASKADAAKQAALAAAASIQHAVNNAESQAQTAVQNAAHAADSQATNAISDAGGALKGIF